MNATGISRNLSSAFGALKDLLALLGVAAIGAYLLFPLREPIERALPLLPALVIDQVVAATPIRETADTPLDREQRAVADFIAKRWRIADDAAAGFVETAYRAGAEHRVDPLLILAVMAIESRYNPVAESVMGARGLMQVIAKYHPEKLEAHGGEQSLLDPDVNILVGTQILREYSRRFGDVETALQMYAGALDDPASTYAGKVLAEKARLEPLRVKVRKTGQAI